MHQCEEHKEIVFSIILASRQIKNFFAQKLRPFNIGIEQVGILAILEKEGTLNITDLSNITLKDKGTISRTIESLCKKQFVKKIQEKEDNRITKISITPQGRDKLNAIKKNKQEIIDIFSCSITEEEEEQFFKILNKIVRITNQNV
ncbi:MarR family transcriptional regulator [Helicobacter sp. 13S00477-4]|uniref:MarR family winged helix-turn-helix transcriptional regulator n=1 Tax=Helicobacter sp. 13S00477-4 TaxID=1905759 RepID=UPI000BA6BCFA|nr:MarR family transcriptional regulator [Helicobacter sp. 13S00477-4]PAF52173.1 hypothetical protein BKH44_03465 [Helicobacter sp. 13S00477-4]